MQEEERLNEYSAQNVPMRAPGNALYKGSAKVTNDLLEHIHLENNVLFPSYEDMPQT